MRSVAIEHQMDVEARVDRLHDSTQKSQKLLIPITGLALADDYSIQNVQRGEKCGCPVGVCNRGFVAPQPRPQWENRLR